jgi:hypothetical protein
LQALPFGVRCRPCEDRRELEQGSARRDPCPLGALSLSPEALGR